MLVDLYRVVKQSLRASVESYSIKAIEELYEFVRTAEVSGGDESTVLFEKWLESGDDSLLAEIEAYNEEDCRSTVALHEWLLHQRPPDLPWRPSPEPEPPADEEMPPERAVLRDALLARSAEEGDAPWLLAQLLDYHRREAKPQWWEWFLHVGLSEEELIADTDTIGGLELVGEPEPDKSSLVYTFSFPEQEHKIGGDAVDPATEKTYGVTVDDEHGLVRLWRGKNRADEPLPRALIPVKPIHDREQRGALARLARAYLDGSARPAVVAVLERRLPRARLDLAPVEAVSTLEDSYLFVQGPPGSGKTWQGAKMAVALMRDGKRVGVTSLSHKAINKLLEEIEREAREQGFVFKGRKKSTGGNEESRFEGKFIDWGDDWRDLLEDELQLLAGTAWLFAREDFHDRGLAEARPHDAHSRGLASARPQPFLDTLFVDEAGQVSLADALAVGSAARNLVLLGDPNQLPQVSQGAQPEEAKVSVLQHLLGSDETVPPRAGHLPRANVAPAAGDLRVHLGGVLRGTVAAGRGERAAFARGRQRPRDRRDRARGAQPVLLGGGGRGRGGDPRAPRDVVHGREVGWCGRSGRTTSSSSPPTTPRCAACASACPPACAWGRWTSSRGRRLPSSSSRWRARPRRTPLAASASPSTATASTSPPRVPSAASCSCAPRASSTPTARRSSRCGW